MGPEDEMDLNGQILCTVRTDPGWAPLSLRLVVF